ncbi:MAG TPA: hypothetical protein VFU43_03035 [Streptosporangiaceae bacterium]|nr:hypothetical protein [Streptosporangiaceae bacterium]
MTATITPLGAADSMMTIAQKETGISMFVLPPAMWINYQFKLCKGNPVNIDKAGQAWRDTAQQLQQIGVELQQAVAAIPPDDWSADDRTAYEQKVKEFCAQLEVMYTFCLAVGVALTVFAYALFVYAVFAVAMGTTIGVLAGIAAAALASVVGAGLYAECLAIAATCLEITLGATAILAGAATGVAAVFQGGALLSAVAEHFKGNDAALGDFVQAEATGSAAALTNLAQNAANAGLAYVNRADDLGASPQGTPKGIPLKAVDLDADRDKDHTWNVGGTATVRTAGGDTITGGGHVRYGDLGLQGIEAEGKVQHGQVTVGGKAGWVQSPDGQDTVYVGENAGYEHKGTGIGAKEDGEVRVDVDGGHPRFDSGKINVGETYKTGQVASQSGEVKAGD